MSLKLDGLILYTCRTRYTHRIAWTRVQNVGQGWGKKPINVR